MATKGGRVPANPMRRGINNRGKQYSNGGKISKSSKKNKGKSK